MVAKMWEGVKNFFTWLLVIACILLSAFMLAVIFADYEANKLKVLANSVSNEIQDKQVAISDWMHQVMQSTGQELGISKKEKRTSVVLDIPLILQMPELRNGCEITSLAMLFQYYGIPKSKMDLVNELKYDRTGIQYDTNGKIKYWGNPNTGFVGDIFGKTRGHGIYHTALYPLLHQYIESAVDLTNSSFDELENKLAEGKPVVVWTTIEHVPPRKWVEWDTPIGPIRSTFEEHAVLLVGYDENFVYINDPLSGVKGQPVDKQQFIETWKQMGEQALTY